MFERKDRDPRFIKRIITREGSERFCLPAIIPYLNTLMQKTECYEANRIYLIRGKKVMLDTDLANL